VWPREISQFSARKLKHHPGSELGALEVEFGPLPMGKPDYSWVWLDAKFDSTQFQKKVPQSEFVCKSYVHFTEARIGYGSRRRNMTRNRNQVRQKLAICDSKD
jgi:hypothetical protein